MRTREPPSILIFNILAWKRIGHLKQATYSHTMKSKTRTTSSALIIHQGQSRTKKSATGSITRPFHDHAPCGSTFGTSQVDGNVFRKATEGVGKEDPADSGEEWALQAVASGRNEISVAVAQAHSLHSLDTSGSAQQAPSNPPEPTAEEQEEAPSVAQLTAPRRWSPCPLVGDTSSPPAPCR